MVKNNQVDLILSSFSEHLICLAQDNIEGIYITGSISLHDFYPVKSDIDFLVVCRELPNDVEKLKQIHKKIAKAFARLSGHYITQETIESKTPEKMNVLSYHQGHLRYQTFEMAPIYLWELRQNAMTIYGKKPETLKINIDLEDVHNFLHRNINTYWAKWVNPHALLSKYTILLLSFPQFTEWIILGITRQLYTLRTGRIISKSEAGYYGLEYLPARYHPIIQQSIEIRKDTRTYLFLKSFRIQPSFLRASQTIECARYMISLFNTEFLQLSRM